MRFSTISIAIAPALFGAISTVALPIPLQKSDLEARNPPPNDPPEGKVFMSNGTKKHLDNLNLHGKDRHDTIQNAKMPVRAGMEEKGATKALIKHLPHSSGSTDPELHVTANLWGPDGRMINSKYGDPPKKGNMHHMYYPDGKTVNPAYKDAVEAAGKRL